MTIYVDVSAAVHSKAGLSRYAASLVNGLAPLLGDRLAFFQNSLGRLGPLEGWPNVPTVGVPWGYKPWRGLVLARHLMRWPIRSMLPNAELFHATEHLLPPVEGIPTVLTVHDLIYERFPEYHKRANYVYLRTAMPVFCKRATAIIAVSESTKRDLMSEYAIPPDKVTVIPEAAAPTFCPQPPEVIAAVRERYHLPQRYILAVGTIEPRKNLGRLVEACGPLFDANLVDALVLVGSLGWLYQGFFEQIAQTPWQDRVLLPGFVREQDLPAVYSGALITAQSSLYEGFGFPPLEAMQHGTPVLSSRSGSLPEVLGKAARYTYINDPSIWAEATQELLEDSSERDRLRQAGLQHVKQFDWATTARQTWQAYSEVAS